MYNLIHQGYILPRVTIYRPWCQPQRKSSSWSMTQLPTDKVPSVQTHGLCRFWPQPTLMLVLVYILAMPLAWPLGDSEVAPGTVYIGHPGSS